MSDPICFLDLNRVNQPLEPAIQSAIRRVLQRGQYILGPEGAAFERAFAANAGVRHAIGTGNGLDALVLAIQALGIPPGSEIIVPANTFIASVLAVQRCACVPVLVEPSPLHFNLDPDCVTAAITPATRAILAVHLYGQIAEWDRLAEIAKAHDLLLIEDAAQAHGAAWRGRKAGSLGAAAAFSFYPTKNLGALGDAGLVTTDDDTVADRIRCLRSYGCISTGASGLAGCNTRLDELQAAVLQEKLPHLDAWNGRRRALAQRYRSGIRNPAVQLPHVDDELAHVWHQFVIRSEWRDALRAHLAERGIGTMIHYPVPPHRQPGIAGLSGLRLPVTEQLSREILSLPMNTALTDSEADAVIDAINRWSP